VTTLSPIPEPSPEEIRRGLAAVEQYAQPVDAEPAAGSAAPGVESRRVRKLCQQVAEARQLDALTDEALATDTHRVRRRRRAAVEAARLHELAQLPTVRAWQAARVSRDRLSRGTRGPTSLETAVQVCFFCDGQISCSGSHHSMWNTLSTRNPYNCTSKVL